MTTYSTSLKLTLIGDGQEAGTWGTTTNNNLGSLLEQAITGYAAINMADSNVTLTNLNGTLDQARNAVIELTGSNSAVRDVIPPVVEKLYTIFNNTTGNFAVRVIGATGTGVNIPNGATCLVYCNGINFINGLSGVAGSFTVAGTINATSTITSAAGISATTGTFSGAITSASPTFTGTVTIPTPSPGSNTTVAASTAFVTNAVTAATGSLGTMSTQNANNVSITGGTITGITDITVADGGTGRSTLTANNILLGNGTSAVNFVAPSTSGNFLVSNGSSWTSTTLASSGVRLGLGITGETWTYPSRGFGTTYTNSEVYPIAVSATATCAFTSEIHAYVNGSLVAWYQWQFNQCFAPDTKIRLWDGSIHTLLELEGKEVELRSLTEDMQIRKSKGKITLTHPDIEVMNVHFSDGTVITCTKIHKFVSVVSKYVNKLIYLQADNLVRGDLIYRDDAAPIMVTKVEFTGQVMDTYCPQMDEYHNFELANGMITHNCGSYGGTFIIVPPGATYRLDSAQGVYNWTELR